MACEKGAGIRSAPESSERRAGRGRLVGWNTEGQREAMEGCEKKTLRGVTAFLKKPALQRPIQSIRGIPIETAKRKKPKKGDWAYLIKKKVETTVVETAACSSDLFGKGQRVIMGLSAKNEKEAWPMCAGKKGKWRGGKIERLIGPEFGIGGTREDTGLVSMRGGLLPRGY